MKFLLTCYIIIINVSGMLLMRNDKISAQQRKRRTSEKKLWLFAFAGGALGMTIGMNKYRHKTKHFTFKYGLPLLTAIDLVIYFTLLRQLS